MRSAKSPTLDFYLLMQVIYLCKKENLAKNRALWAPEETGIFSELIPLITTACFRLSKKTFIHFRVSLLML